MITKTISGCATFAVDDVELNKSSLSTCKAYEAVKRLLHGDLETCSDYHSDVVANIRYQPLLAAVYEAFAQHRPLILGPDEVWITLAQGVAQHMAIHSERLRDRFVSHQGRLKLEVNVTGFVKGSPENPWGDAFAIWGDLISGHVGPAMYDLLMGDFSTTTVVERAANHVVLMDIFQRYFHYEAVCICGIPNITLAGTAEDWQKLREKIDQLDVFDLGWWTSHLRPIFDQFVRAARGDVDVDHWRGICKLRDQYGGAIINGWIAKLFPYLQEFYNGPLTRKNPIFETGEGFSTLVAPPGLSKVPFTWRILEPGKPEQLFEMEAIGGLVGVTQEPESGALRAKAGWAVREAPQGDALLNRLDREHVTVQRPEAKAPSRVSRESDLWSAEMEAFYFRFDSAKLFAGQSAARFEILSKNRVDQFRSLFRKWLKFCILNDGSYLAIDAKRVYALRPDAKQRMAALEKELGAQRDAEEKRVTKSTDLNVQRRLRSESKVLQEVYSRTQSIRAAGQFEAYPVVHCKNGTSSVTGDCIMVAESFNEFLQLAIENKGEYWWLTSKTDRFGITFDQWK